MLRHNGAACHVQRAALDEFSRIYSEQIIYKAINALLVKELLEIADEADQGREAEVGPVGLRRTSAGDRRLEELSRKLRSRGQRP